MRTIRLVILVLLLTFSPVYAHVLSSSPSVAESDCRLAREFLKQGNYDGARKAAEQALHFNPVSPEAETLAGQAELALDHFEAAQKHLQGEFVQAFKY